jgi:hypothetical protein
MTRLKDIERLSADDQVRVYSELAAHFRAMESLVHSEGAKLTFTEMARDLDERAVAVTVFAR